MGLQATPPRVLRSDDRPGQAAHLAFQSPALSAAIHRLAAASQALMPPCRIWTLLKMRFAQELCSLGRTHPTPANQHRWCPQAVAQLGSMLRQLIQRHVIAARNMQRLEFCRCTHVYHLERCARPQQRSNHISVDNVRQLNLGLHPHSSIATVCSSIVACRFRRPGIGCTTSPNGYMTPFAP